MTQVKKARGLFTDHIQANQVISLPLRLPTFDETKTLADTLLGSHLDFTLDLSPFSTITLSYVIPLCFPTVSAPSLPIPLSHPVPLDIFGFLFFGLDSCDFG